VGLPLSCTQDYDRLQGFADEVL
jgi:hypothetical protein